MNLLIVFIIGLGTYLTRLSFIGAIGDRRLPPAAERALRFVAPAVFGAIVLPAVIRPEGSVDLTLANARWLAAIVAGFVTWKTRNVALTAVIGLVALWSIEAVV
jgi:branched-subunit amino acid transport protein